jgi:hypothetical protein
MVGTVGSFRMKDWSLERPGMIKGWDFQPYLPISWEGRKAED